MKRVFWLIMLISACFPWVLFGGEREPAAGAEILLEQAEDFFREGMELAARDNSDASRLFEKAAVYYEKIIRDEGIENGQLYYNAGNAYFLAGDIGRGILNYLRAEQYIPDDANLRQNLEYARSRRRDTIEEKEQTRLVRIIFFWHYGVTSFARFIVFTFFFLLVWIFAALKLFFKQGLFTFIMVVSVVIAVLFGGSLVADLAGIGADTRGVVLADEVTARKGDNETYQPSFIEPLHEGTEFRLKETRREWYHVELMDGRQCWLPADTVALVE